MFKLLTPKISYFFLALIFITVATQFLFSNIKVLQNPALDFSVLYQAGSQIIHKQDPYSLKTVSSFHTPPPSLLVFSLISYLPVGLSQLTWYIISLVSFAVGSFFLFKTLGEFGHKVKFKTSGLKIWLIYLTLVLVYFPFRYNLGSGEVNNFLFLFLTSTFYFLQKKKNLLATFPLALGIIFKITPLFFLFVFFLQKKIKLIFLALFWVLLLSLITITLFGPELFRNYFDVIPRYFNLITPAYYNQSLAAFIGRSLESFVLSRWVSISVLIISMSMLTYYCYKLPKNSFNSQTVIWNISILYTLIFSTFAWQHHFTIAIFPLITTFYLALQFKTQKIFFCLLALSYLLMAINIKTPADYSGWGPLGAVILSHVLWGVIILIFLNYYLMGKVLDKKKAEI